MYASLKHHANKWKPVTLRSKSKLLDVTKSKIVDLEAVRRINLVKMFSKMQKKLMYV
jgi:hypothetical protein